MNRAEQRRTQHQKTATYNFTEKQINEMVKPMIDKAKKEAIDEAIDGLIYVIAQTLNDSEGFGTVRINRVLSRMLYKAECAAEGYVKLEDIKQWCVDNKIQFGDGGK